MLSVKKAAAAAKPLQSCPTLCDPRDGSLPGSALPGILQARTLEWVATSFSKTCMHAKSLNSGPLKLYYEVKSPDKYTQYAITRRK